MKCVRCEGPVYTKNYKPTCRRCGTQPPWDRSGTQILGRDPEQIEAITGTRDTATSATPANVSRETTPPWE